MQTFYHQLAEQLEQDAAVIATVVAVAGSAPREVGAKLFLCPNGKLVGTIGGGAGEAKVCQWAMEVLHTGINQIVEIDLSGAAHRETQGVCGGSMKVWVSRWQGDAAIALAQSIITMLEVGQAPTLVTPLQSDSLPYLLPTGEVAVPQIVEGNFLESLYPNPILLIVGAGHVAIPLAQIAQIIGFQVWVVDDRPEFAHPDRFPTGIKAISAPFSEAINYLSVTDSLYAALVTRGYQQDLEALTVLLDRSTRYIGMIGSQKRVRLVHQALQQQGYAMEQLQAIYAPIGLAIGALTPEEIAVSICAELIQIRRNNPGNSKVNALA